MLEYFFLKENTDFTPFTLQHLSVVFFFAIFGLILIRWAKNQPEKTQNLAGNIFAFSISLVVIVNIISMLLKGNFNYKEHLPLHLCTFLALIIPIFSLTRKYLHYEVIFFLVLTGTFQAVITPTEYNFMNIPFLKYWLVHAGLVIYMLYATFVYKMRPTLKSVEKSYIGMQVYIVLMFIINYILGSNYFYTMGKPNGKTLLDAFGEWPYYILVVEIVIIPYFLLIYLPFYLTRKKA